jgi:hypothetical protein
MSLEVLDVQLGAVHHTRLIGLRAYNFVCAAEVLGPGKHLGEDALLRKCDSRASFPVIGVIGPESFDVGRINVGHKDICDVDRVFLQIVKQPDCVKDKYRIVDLCS